MKKLIRTDLESSFINLEFSKLDLLVLLHTYMQGADSSLDDNCFSLQEEQDLYKSLGCIKDAVDENNSKLSTLEQKMKIKNLLYKLLAVTEASIAGSTKH